MVNGRERKVNIELTFNVQRSRALVSGHLDSDAGGVVDLAVLDDQLPLLPLRHDLDSANRVCIRRESLRTFHTNLH